MVCPVCEKPFTTKVLKSSKARRVGSDIDLRPIFKDIDTLKYGVCSCPNCGYSATHNTFDKIVNVHKKLIKDNVGAMFRPVDRSAMEIYDYDTAIVMHKMAYMCATVKNGKDSEKGYYSLLLSWLYRGKGESAKTVREKKALKNEEERFYMEANVLLSKAAMNERPPFMTLNQDTLDYILAYMSYYFEAYDRAAKLVSGILISSTTSRNLKEKAHDLKDMILAARSGNPVEEIE